MSSLFGLYLFILASSRCEAKRQSTIDLPVRYIRFGNRYIYIFILCIPHIPAHHSHDNPSVASSGLGSIRYYIKMQLRMHHRRLMGFEWCMDICYRYSVVSVLTRSHKERCVFISARAFCDFGRATRDPFGGLSLAIRSRALHD